MSRGPTTPSDHKLLKFEIRNSDINNQYMTSISSITEIRSASNKKSFVYIKTRAGNFGYIIWYEKQEPVIELTGIHMFSTVNHSFLQKPTSS